jgi:hypothetical protein
MHDSSAKQTRPKRLKSSATESDDLWASWARRDLRPTGPFVVLFLNIGACRLDRMSKR